MEIIPLGDSALIVRVREQFEDAPEETLDEVLRTLQQLRNAAIPGVIEVAPAYTTVALFFDPVAVAKARETPGEVFDWLAEKIRSAIASGSTFHRRRSAAAPRLIEIPVCYDAEFGLDLDRVGEHTKLSAGEVVDLHSDSRIPSGLHWVRSGLSVSDWSAKDISDAAPGHAAQGNSSRFGRHRRRANGNLSVAFARRLEPDWPDAVKAF